MENLIIFIILCIILVVVFAIKENNQIEKESLERRIRHQNYLRTGNEKDLFD